MNNKEVEDCTIFLTLGGSHAYGMNTPESDVDVRGVCIPTNRSYYTGMGINKFEQKDSGWDDDRVIYDLRKAMILMADNNPNVLELLFTDERHWIKVTDSWHKILEHKEKFLSKKVKHTYSGYAIAQLRRIQKHRNYLLNPPKKKPLRSDYGLGVEKSLGKEDIGAVQWLLSDFLKNTVQFMNFSDETKEELNEFGNFVGTVQSNLAFASGLNENHWKTIQKSVGASDEFIDQMMREKAYTNAMNQWQSYQSWKKNRNSKRAELEKKYGFDAKHASHLVRLMRQGIEILKTGHVQVFRPDREELLAIRNGAWTYEELVEFAEKSEAELNELYKTSKLPKQPDRVFLDKLCQEVIESKVF